MTDPTPKSAKSVAATASLVTNNPYVKSLFTSVHLVEPSTHVISSPPASSSPFAAAAVATGDDLPEFAPPSSSSHPHPPPLSGATAATDSALDTLAYVATTASPMASGDHTSGDGASNEDFLRILRGISGLAVNDSAFSPQPFYGKSSDDDVASWVRQFERYATFRALDDSTKLQLFRMLMKGQAAEWLNSSSVEDISEYDDLIAAFRERFALSDVQLCQKASRLWGREQSATETVDEYVADMRKAARQLQMADDNMLRFAIMRGLRPAIRLHVLQSNSTTVDDAIKAARTAEAALQSVPDSTSAVGELTATMKEFMTKMTSSTAAPSTPTVAVVAGNRPRRTDSCSPSRVRFESSNADRRSSGDRSDYRRQASERFANNQQFGNRRPYQRGRGYGKQQSTRDYDCRNCSRQHGEGLCAARNVHCFHCNRRGHFARACRSRGNGNNYQQQQQPQQWNGY
jgi:hypothetical protein